MNDVVVHGFFFDGSELDERLPVTVHIICNECELLTMAMPDGVSCGLCGEEVPDMAHASWYDSAS
jgi:hypothetical protein